MPKPRILVIYKLSAFSRIQNTDTLANHFRKGRYWKILCGSHQRHVDTIQKVREVLKKEGISSVFFHRNQLQQLQDAEKRFDLAISVGGDGTLLDSCHYLRSIPILGVNSDPQRSVARFSCCTCKNFQSVLKAYLAGDLPPVEVPRIEFFINGKVHPWRVLNDLLVSTLSPAGTSRYMLKIGAQTEEQMSSGVWVSTAAGSTAANASAGGKILPVTAKKFQFVVREVYQRKFGRRRHVKGVLSRDQALEIYSYMKDGRIFVDGSNRVVPFGLGDRLKIRLSKSPMKVVGLRLRMPRKIEIPAKASCE